MNLEQLKAEAQACDPLAEDPNRPLIYVAHSDAATAEKVRQAIVAQCSQVSIDPVVNTAGSFGLYYLEPIVTVQQPGRPAVVYYNMTPDRATRLAGEGLNGTIPSDLVLCSLGDGDIDNVPKAGELPLFKLQERMVLGNCGRLNPEDIYAYIREADGFGALNTALQMPADQVIDKLDAAGLRGRGGAGFPTAEKWHLCRSAPGDEKIMVCNAVDGDPKARTAELLVGGDPYSVLEGLLIGAYAVGARRCIVCLDKEQTTALTRLEQAVSRMKDLGLLGDNILETGLQASIDIRLVDGGLVKGEQTALLRALQGRQAMPYVRTTRTALNGLDGHPTVVDNVETLCGVKAVLQDRKTAFQAVGTESSKGTKIMTIAAGDSAAMTIEVPFGTTLRNIIETVDDGLLDGAGVQSVQLGGPTGCFFAADGLDTVIDFEAIAAGGGILGSGTIDLIRDGACPVAVARDIARYLHEQSCGKCVFCREGTLQLADILVNVTDNKAKPKDVELIRELGRQMKNGCICGLGRTAANPVLSSLALFPDEFDAHIKDKKCLMG